MFNRYLVSKVLAVAAVVGSVFALGGGFVNFANIAHADPLASQSMAYTIYVGQGCPHCAKVEAFVEENNLMKIFPITIKEVYYDRANAQEFTAVATKIGAPLDKRGVPFMVYGGQYWVGDQPIIKVLSDRYEGWKVTNAVKRGEGVKVPGTAGTSEDGAVVGTAKGGDKTTEVKQENAATKAGVTISVLIWAAIVDSINPCEFAILIMLLSTILAGSGKRRALYAGLAFSAAIFLSYFAMGLGLYKAISIVGVSALFMKIIAVVAVLLGLFNLKDFFFYGKGFLMEVPLSWRPKMKAIIRSVTSPLGAFAIGFLISLFLLPCTSGPYIVILGLLGAKETFWSAFKYLLLYNVVFVLPMLIVTIAVYKGFSTEKAEEIRIKRLRVLHLIAGAVLVVMGVVIFVTY